ncbi:hypothetical protein [Litchfieldella rifensis]|uniref:Carboxyltransferase domain-containing protein n=1 Tax=Litchfieldella rifensis TaxID=762643 RepID=A0ABV7LIA9_9GAMM
MVDTCYSIGSIQVSSGNEPLILNRDVMSGGEYTMIDNVTSADMDTVGGQPHQKVWFVAKSLAEALEACAHY